jgi:hypothetical protein
MIAMDLTHVAIHEGCCFTNTIGVVQDLDPSDGQIRKSMNTTSYQN